MTHSELVSFLAMTNFMYGDEEFRVLLMMVGRLDFSMRTHYVALSYPDMRKYSSLKNYAIQSAIKSLKQKGLVAVVSGEKEKEKAYQLRKKAFRSIQTRLEGKETNVYDVSGLVYVAKSFYELRTKYSTDEVLDMYRECFSTHVEKGIQYPEYISGLIESVESAVHETQLTYDTLSDDDRKKVMFVVKHTNMAESLRVRNIRAYLASFSSEQIQSMLVEYEKLTHLDRYSHILSAFRVLFITNQHAEISHIIHTCNKLSLRYASDTRYLYILVPVSRYMSVMKVLHAYSSMFNARHLDLGTMKMFHITVSDLENMLEN